MKNLLITLFSLTAFLASSQTSHYHSFPDSNAFWNYQRKLVATPGPPLEYSIEISGDTIINSLNYQKLNRPYAIPFYLIENSDWFLGYLGAIHEDEAEKKVYYLPKDSTEEILLYDFNLEVGDTVEGF